MISSQDGTDERLLRAVLRLWLPACSATGADGGTGGTGAAVAGWTAAVAEPFSAAAGPGG